MTGAGSAGLRRVHFRIPAPRATRRPRLRKLRPWVLGPLHWLLAHAWRVPGLDFHRRAATLGLSLWMRGRLTAAEARPLVFQPMDSVRYLEFGAVARFLADAGPHGPRYLDLSSPRLFPLLWLAAHPGLEAELVNPDGKDLEATRRLAAAAGLGGRCRFHEKVIDALDFPAGSFDLVTCISVLEHIPGEAGPRAFARLWELLRPGGRLLVTVPCAREPFEEYVDLNEYGVLAPDERGEVFGSLFADEAMLEERFFRIAGPPARAAVYGERTAGSFDRNRDRKLSDPYYPWWREPTMMGRAWRRYARVGDLPGLGVVAMEFVRGARP